MNASVKKPKKTATEVDPEREREREREQNLVYMMQWNQKDFKNKICKAQNVSSRSSVERHGYIRG